MEDNDIQNTLSKEISIFIANTISDPKKKKEIWLSIFNHFKHKKMNVIEEIVNKSGGILKILDVLPYLMGNIQLKDIKEDLLKCINIYESKLAKLKIKNQNYSYSAEIITRKAKNLGINGYKSLRLKFQHINCSICLKNLKESNFYIFPCQHSFDFECLIKLLFSYNVRNIGDDEFKNRMDNIKNIISEIKSLSEKQNYIIDKEITEIEKKKTKKQNLIIRTFTSFRSKRDKPGILFSNEEEKKLEELEKSLDELLCVDCPLCGMEMILSTQSKFGGEEDLEWMV